MKSLLISSAFTRKPGEERIPERIHTIFQGLSRHALSTAENAKKSLEEAGLKVKTLKKPREHKPNDSYIIGIQTGQNTISVKIHLDIFPKCARVYSDTELLDRLVEDHDLPEILYTTVMRGYRLVFYKWEEGVDPLILIRQLSLQIQRKIEIALTHLLQSLEKKGCQISCSNASSHEFLYQKEKRKMVLLDPNKILLRHNSHISSVLRAKRIFQSWIDAIHTPTVKKAFH